VKKQMNKKALLIELDRAELAVDHFFIFGTGLSGKGERNYKRCKEALEQTRKMAELFYSPLGHMTKYNPEEEWIRIR